MRSHAAQTRAPPVPPRPARPRPTAFEWAYPFLPIRASSEHKYPFGNQFETESQISCRGSAPHCTFSGGNPLCFAIFGAMELDITAVHRGIPQPRNAPADVYRRPVVLE